MRDSKQVVRGKVVLSVNLSEWLNRIQSLHVVSMDLSLERVIEVAKRLNLLKPTATVVTIAGTNGKGSCAAGLEAVYLRGGYRVGVFTSPILFKHNEYVRIQGIEASDAQFCEAFEQIERARAEITLTPFEFNALAGFYIFYQEKLDVWILEVGLGGRFDATNVVDSDLAVVTSIGIDHVEWLGDTREKIAYEKAGIFRKNKPVVCGDFDPPITLIECAKVLDASLYCQNKNFHYEKQSSTWMWESETTQYKNLPMPALALQNMSTVLMAVELLQPKLPVKMETIRAAMANVRLIGRIHVVPGKIPRIFDVSHNPASAELLKKSLQEKKCSGKTRAVFSMLMDKDIVSTLQVMKECIDEWHIAALPIKRGATVQQLKSSFSMAEIHTLYAYDSIVAAYEKALEISLEGDRVIVFGSFHTVADVGQVHAISFG